MTTPRLLSERYELGEVLGFGGMSEVHRGLDTRLGRDVAVKVLRADLARDPQFQMRFRREAQNAAALNHPAIVAVYDTGDVQSDFGPLPYIVMEYVDGQTLREIVKTTGPMSQQQVLDVMADVCAALDFSHRHQIIHRDVKPANIMINRAGAVKVMDFGIARALGEGQNVTQTAAVIGTAQYLSPEQARGEAVDARSDVYAAGCVLYELLTGEPPFTGDSPVAVAYQHVREDPKSPSEVNSAVPPALDAIVLKALSKNPANRYQSAAEMRSDLVRVRGGQAPLAPSVLSADERTAMMAAGPATGPTRRINGRPHQPTAATYAGEYYAEEEPRRTGRVVAIVLGVLVVLGLVGFVAYQLLSGPATPSQVAVPGVVGQSQQDASNQIIAAGLRVGNVAQQESAVEQVGKVINSNPAAGTQVAERSNVDLTVGSGPAFVNVPALQGMSVADATALLKSQGLVLGKQTNAPTNDATQVGKVVNSSPGPGVRVKGGSTVDIAVGVQQTALTVPDVTGQDKDDAKKALEAKGFEVDTNTVDGGGQKDTVLSTDPAAGTQAQPGSKVTMNVSKGNQQNQLPNVVGQTLASAAQNLAAAGYTNLAVQGSRDPNSIVTDQNPSDSDTNTDKRIVLTTQSSGGGGTANNGFGLLN
ncbi:MAG TPA: Stk1 family PASTA domain-containing Ser/Thr kinase [Pseudonocardia sp.]|nr:Stk1 family PASTA domain-containing Ser/Thr kinase [Pseudonocardia sp.]